MAGGIRCARDRSRARPDQGDDNIFDRGNVQELCVASHIQDIRDAAGVAQIVASSQPAIIFHLAAQPLVRRAYREPLVTFATNVMGTVNVLEAARAAPSVAAVVCVTTDKVYANNEWCWPYRETDPLGESIHLVPARQPQRWPPRPMRPRCFPATGLIKSRRHAGETWSGAGLVRRSHRPRHCARHSCQPAVGDPQSGRNAPLAARPGALFRLSRPRAAPDGRTPGKGSARRQPSAAPGISDLRRTTRSPSPPSSIACSTAGEGRN